MIYSLLIIKLLLKEFLEGINLLITTDTKFFFD